ncbi:MAG: hypothetical protein HOP28_12205 [Gemmatimonadales bacterium]|nr:hypothetical protein [Gemmatimonadales bacterium]
MNHALRRLVLLVLLAAASLPAAAVAQLPPLSCAQLLAKGDSLAKIKATGLSTAARLERELGIDYARRTCAVAPTPPPPPAPPSTPTPVPEPAPATWARCAEEGGVCAFTGTRQVRYGTPTLNVVKTLAGGTPCTNAVFGDPAVGVGKECWYGSTAEPTPGPRPDSTPSTPPAQDTVPASPPVPPGVVGPGANQPSGFLTAMATKFDFVPPINTSLNGWNSRVTGGTIDANNAFTVQDSDAPYGSTVLRIQFPAISNGEHLGGNAPVWLFGGGNFGSGARLYVRVRMKIDARWSNMGNGGTKLMFVRNSSATDNHYTGFNLMETDSPTSMTASAGWQGTGEPGLSLFHRPSTGAVNLVDGQYHDIEWLLTPENPAGSTNGRVDVWVDGVKQNFSYGWENNIRMFNPGDVRRWEGIEIQPTFGGGIKDPPALSTPLWWNIASVYVSTGT